QILRPLHDRADAVLHLHVAVAELRAVAATTDREVAPEELLHRPHARRLWLPLLVRLPLERHPRRERSLLAILVDPRDLEPQTAGQPAVRLPRDECDFVVRVSLRGNDRCHCGTSSIGAHDVPGVRGATTLLREGAGPSSPKVMSQR